MFLMYVMIENMTATVNTGKQFSIDHLTRYSEAQKDMHTDGARYKFEQSQKIVTVYENGILVCIGAKSSDSAWHALSKILQKLHIKNITKQDMSINNIVVHAKLMNVLMQESEVDTFIDRLSNNSSYEQIKYHQNAYCVTFTKGAITARIYLNGNMICNGPSINDIIEMITQIKEITVQIT